MTRIVSDRMLGVFLVLLLSGCSERHDELPEGMIFFSGGEFVVGTDEGEPNEGPPFRTDVKSFYLEAHPVTVGQFRSFVRSTGYATEAERFGNSAVFDFRTGTWSLVAGATWEFPLGADGPAAEEIHPVTQVSWNDAQAYCRWKGRRLPTEIEWEFAAANGRSDRKMYSWGDRLVMEGTYRANVWQGRFPDSVAVRDGFLLTSPVGHYGTTEAGVSDMGGNVWEWCNDAYRQYQGSSLVEETGPDDRVIRGGSFLCDEKVCHGYRITARGRNSKESATIHMGFRTAMDAL